MDYQKITDKQEQDILNQSAKVMPTSPSALGYNESQIRAFLWKPIESLTKLLRVVEGNLQEYSKGLDDATREELSSDIGSIYTNLETIFNKLDEKVSGDDYYPQIDALTELINQVAKRLPQEEVDRIKGSLQALENTVEDVEAIAKGSNQAISFNNYEELVDYLNNLSPNKLKVGQNIYVATRNVPDVWVQKDWGTGLNNPYTYTNDDEIVELLNKGNLVVGHYQIQPLETQKVTLTDYVSKNDIDTELSTESTNPVQNKKVTEALNERVKFTDYATKEKAGVVKIDNSGDYGLYASTTGQDLLRVFTAPKSDINAKSSEFRPITPKNLDYAVKKALADCKLSTKDPDNDWTDDEKQSARDLLGVTKALAGKVSLEVSTSTGYPSHIIGTRIIDGVVTAFRYNTQGTDRVSGNRVPLTFNGGRLKAGTPTEGDDLTTKDFVDTEIAKVGVDTFNWDVEADDDGSMPIGYFKITIPNYAQYKYFVYNYAEAGEQIIAGGDASTGVFGISPMGEGTPINLGIDTFTVAFEGTTAILVGQRNDNDVYITKVQGNILGGIYGIK